MNIIFWTLNRLKRVHLLLIELKHPIFGFERSNFEHCSIHHYSWVPSSSLKFPRVGNKDYYCCSYPTSKQYKVWWSKANWISKIVYPIRMHNALRGMMKSFHRTAVNKVNLILQTQKCTHNCSVIISFQLVLVGKEQALKWSYCNNGFVFTFTKAKRRLHFLNFCYGHFFGITNFFSQLILFERTIDYQVVFTILTFIK